MGGGQLKISVETPEAQKFFTCAPHSSPPSTKLHSRHIMLLSMPYSGALIIPGMGAT